MSLKAVVGFCLSVLAVGAMAAPAGAAEAKPLKITRFTLQTTRTQAAPGLTHDNYGFVNEPVPFTQASGHPNGQEGGADGLTYTGEFESEDVDNGEGPEPVPTRDPKDIATVLPPGLLGNPTSVPRCPLKQALSLGDSKPCPVGTQVGMAVLSVLQGEGLVGPIVNVTPEAGQSAEFALENTHGLSFLLTAHVVKTPEGYGLVVADNGIPIAKLYRAELTFWGVPAASIHDPERGLFCGRGQSSTAGWKCGAPNIDTPSHGSGGEPSGDAEETPFLTMPSNCAAGPETAVMKADSWEEPGRVGVGGDYEGYAQATTTLPGATGCALPPFGPGVEVRPDTGLADAPVGLGLDLTVPQFEEPQRLATSELRNAAVTLPLGMSVSPGIVDGIQACNETGPEGINFTGPESEEVGLNGEPQLAPGRCPDASIVGTAEAETPLLEAPVQGHVYLARPGCGGPGQHECTAQDALDGNLYQLYLELGGAGALANAGVNLKVRLKTEANPATGQLTTVALDNPQFPFSDLRIRLNGGPRAPLDNPAVCGPATTTTDLTPWSAPGATPAGAVFAGLPDATPSSFFDVSGCADPPGLSPGFTAGTVTPQAGAFSAFTLNLTRRDREQYIKGIQVHTPAGLLGLLASVQLCEEPLAENGHCPEASKIGTTRVASGAGSHPFEIGGNVYLTKGYGGAPFGLSIVTNAVAGPFNLGLVVVRARIDVDPGNSALTVTTDETGPYAIPQILDGVPLRLQRVTVNIDRPGFMFNPTNCSGQQVTATISGSQNATANVQMPFAVGGCQSLAFKPTFTVSTSGRTSKANGASLDAKVTYPPYTPGSEANIALAKVELPKQLPSRLTTLQQACTAAQFANNPAGCPAASVVGIARATTPLLPVGLEGPAYFVSHGGEAFPSLIVVLQGDGVRVDLVGSTFISKTGVTSSTFKTVPDVPVGTFELYLPEGRYSALTANANLCSLTSTVTVKRNVTRRVHGRTVKRTVKIRVQKPASLKMPTEFVAQNGAVLKQSTSIAVTGCPRARTTTAKQKAKQSRRNGGVHASRVAHTATIGRGRTGK